MDVMFGKSNLLENTVNQQHPAVCVCVSVCVCVTFVTLECVRGRVWLSPSLRSVGACVWPWLPERVVVVRIPCVLTYQRTGR